MRAYKLTDEKMQTHNGFQWTPGEWKETDGKGDLCGAGWLHFYESAEMSALMNPIHANMREPICWEAEVECKFRFDSCLKFGATRGRIVNRVKLPSYTATQLVAFAILCAYPFGSESWKNWADRWLSGEDRSSAAAQVAAAEADAARSAAAWASAWASAWAAADAAASAAAAAEVADVDIALYILLCAEAAKDF